MENGELVPILLYSIKICNTCENLVFTDPEQTINCCDCGGESVVRFYRSKMVTHFLSYLERIELTCQKKNSFTLNVLAHNASRFDAHYILATLLDDYPQGTVERKLLSLEFSRKIKFMNSLNMLLSQLANLHNI